MTRFEIDAKELDRLHEWAARLGEGSEDAINRVFHGSEAGDIAKQAIDAGISPSGRRFKGHSGSAQGAAWANFKREENLALTVTTKSKYGYLYFPDDGTNTRRHVGNQRFFERGGKVASPRIIDMCVKEIIKELSK